MALVLSLREGQDFFVEDERVVVTSVSDGVRFSLEIEKTGKTYDVDDQSAVEIFRDVMVSAGESRQMSLARVVIDAPRDVLILRGDRYAGEAKVTMQARKW